MSRGTVAGLSTARLGRISTLLQDRYVTPGRIAGGQALVARRGEVAYHACFGSADPAAGMTWRDDTIVRIYSMTKPIVSVALMLLWERGLFALDAPVTDFLPEWHGQRVWVSGEGEAIETVAPHRPVSFRDLLSHTSGLTYGGLLDDLGIPEAMHPVDQLCREARLRRDRDEDLDAFVGKLGRLPLRFQPGRQWMYSLATDVLGALVQRIAGWRLDRFLAEEIFVPLGMIDTGFFVPEDKSHRLAACYRHRPDELPELSDDPRTSRYLREPVFFSGGGGLVSTMADYHRFCEMLRRGGELDGARIIGPRTLALMARNHLPGGLSLAELSIDGFAETTPAGIGFGLGFATVIDGVRAGTPSEGEIYWGGVASTLFWVDPREDLVVIFLTQLTPSTIHDFRGPLRNIVYGAIEN